MFELNLLEFIKKYWFFLCVCKTINFALSLIVCFLFSFFSVLLQNHLSTSIIKFGSNQPPKHEVSVHIRFTIPARKSNRTYTIATTTADTKGGAGTTARFFPTNALTKSTVRPYTGAIKQRKGFSFSTFLIIFTRIILDTIWYDTHSR